MCLILFAHRATPRYRLILAANRDEFFDRPAAPARWWADHPDILAGRDLTKGGTWLGIHRDGRWTAVTNFREGVRPDPALRSRGLLTKEFLTGRQNARAYAGQLSGELSQYAGFNLLVGDEHDVFYASNRPPTAHPVEPGLHGLSNHLLNSAWPKVRAGRSAVGTLLDAEEDLLVAGLFNVLADRRRAPDADLPSTGVSLEWERVLSSSFIVSEGYGTRASTVVLVRADASARVEERAFGPLGEEMGRDRFDVGIRAPA